MQVDRETGPGRGPGVQRGPVRNPAALARVLTALAGGIHTTEWSRKTAAAIERDYPGSGDLVRGAYRFHSKAALKAVTDGAQMIIFGAAGLPLRPDLHEEAAAASERTRFLLVDPDQTTVLLRRAEAGPRTTVARGSMRWPRRILKLARAAGLELPLHVQVVLAFSFWPDDVARKVVARWAENLEAGSSLALSAAMAPDGGRPDGRLRGVAGVYPHTAKDIRSWIEDAGMEVAGPGVTIAQTWPAAAVGDAEPGGSWQVLCAVGVKTR